MDVVCGIHGLWTSQFYPIYSAHWIAWPRTYTQIMRKHATNLPHRSSQWVLVRFGCVNLTWSTEFSLDLLCSNVGVRKKVDIWKSSKKLQNDQGMTCGNENLMWKFGREQQAGKKGCLLKAIFGWSQTGAVLWFLIHFSVWIPCGKKDAGICVDLQASASVVQNINILLRQKFAYDRSFSRHWKNSFQIEWPCLGTAHDGPQNVLRSLCNLGHNLCVLSQRILSP